MSDLSNVFLIYRIHPHGDEDTHHHLVAKFFLDGGHFDVLEDHGNVFSGLGSQSPEKIAAAIHRMSDSMYFRVINAEDLRQGRHPEFLAEHEGDAASGPESRFEYHRQGMPAPQVLEFHAGKAFLDGHPLESQDLQQLLDNVHRGHANIAYKQQEPDELEKAEEFFVALSKVEPHLESALSGLREAVRAGHVHPQVLKDLSREIFRDTMVKRVGNKRAYEDFLSRPKKGVHIRMDGANFGDINKKHGFETGNKAITTLGETVRQAADESVGSKNAKLFRIGGDEFHLHVPTHEHAALFARTLRSKLEAIPPIGGTHPLAMSMGFGHTPEHAESAMINAKTQAKLDPGYRAGRATSHAASLVPGFEGHIPVEHGPAAGKPLAEPSMGNNPQPQMSEAPKVPPVSGNNPGKPVG